MITDFTEALPQRREDAKERKDFLNHGDTEAQRNTEIYKIIDPYEMGSNDTT